MMGIEIYGNILAGLGIFFFAFRMFSQAMQDPVGHRARAALVKFTNTLKSSSLVGFFTGFCLQDLNIVACVIGSMTALGALTMRKLIFIIASANIGALIFLYFIFLDIKILIVYMLGITGILLYLERPYYLRSLYEILFYFFLIQFGVMFINSQSGAVVNLPEVQSFVTMLKAANPLLTFFASAAFVVLVQSAIPMLLIAINLFAQQAIPFEYMMIIIYGIHLGNASRTYIFSMGLEGVNKQIFMYQTLFGILVAFLFLFIYYLESYLGTHLVKNLILSLSITPAMTVLNLILFIEMIVASISMLASKPIASWLSRFYPSIEETNLSSLRHLNTQLVNDTDTAIQALYKEIALLIRSILRQLEYRITPGSSKSYQSIIQEHNDFVDLTRQINEFIHEISSRNFKITAIGSFFDAVEEFHHVTFLENSVYLLCTTPPPATCSEETLTLFNQSFESAYAMISILLEYFETYEDKDWVSLNEIYKLNPILFKQLQDNILKHVSPINHEENYFIFAFLRLMQQISWTINQFKPPDSSVKEILVAKSSGK